MSKLYKYSVFFSAWSAFFAGYFFRNSISPIVDVLEHDFNTNASGVAVLGSFIHLFYFTPQIAHGILLQFVPGKYVLPVSTILLGTALCLFSFSTNVLYATITSSMAGFVMGPQWLCFVRIIDDLFTRAQVPFVIGIQMTLTYGGLFTMNYVQAYVYEHYKQWKIIFFCTAVGCWISGALLFTLVCFDHTNTKRKKIIIESSTELSRMHPLETDQTRLLSNASLTDLGFKSKLNTIKIGLKRGFALKLNWILGIWGYSGLSLVNGFIGFWFISYLMLKFEMSRPTASLISGSFYLMRAVSAIVYGRLAMLFARRKVFLVIGSVLYICTLAIIYVVPPSDGSVMRIVVITLNFISGIGAGCFGIMWCLQREYNAHYNCKDMAAGLVNTIINASGFVTQLFIGEMLDFQWMNRDGTVDQDGIRMYSVSDYNFAFLILAVMVGVGIVTALLLKETYANNLDYSAKSTPQ
eukprot:163893_1